MQAIWLGFITALKGILLKVLSEKFFVWLLFWSADMIVQHTNTTKDDEFLKQIKKVYDE